MARVVEWMRKNVTNILLGAVIFILLLNSFSMPRPYSQAGAYAGGYPAIAPRDYASGEEKTTSVYISLFVGYGELNKSRGYVASAISDVGGAIVSENFHYSEVSSSISLSAKIPHNESGRFEAMLEKEGKVVSLTRDVNDISRQYSHLGDEIESLKKFRERLLELSKNASISELIQIEEKLGEVETELRRKEAELEFYSSRISYDMYHITVSEREHPWRRAFSSKEEMARNFFMAMNAGLNFIIAVSGFAVPFIPVIAAFLLWRASRARKRKR